VIERIRAVRGQTKLLVVAAKADSFFHKHRLPLSSSLPFVTTCPSRPPSGCHEQHNGMFANTSQLDTFVVQSFKVKVKAE